MSNPDVQLTFADDSEEYKAFVDKFKPRKTTDDCYTPGNVYEAVASWVADQYGLDRSTFVRPFWPGGDYERHEYPDGCVVVDNPPFSIVTPVVRFYLRHGIRFFLFAPHLVNFNVGKEQVCHLPVDAEVTYANGAVVSTSFVTDLDDRVVWSAPSLHEAVEAAEKANRAARKADLPRYVYPDALVTAAAVGRLSGLGVDFSVASGDAVFVRALDSQRAAGKAVFGGGFLLSERAAAERAAAERAAAERAAAERAAAERAAAERWGLSERERRLQAMMGGGS